jgi:hypothetical protein
VVESSCDAGFRHEGGFRVTQPTTTQCLLFPDLSRRPVVACFDLDHGSSDGGAILLKAADRRLGLIDRLADCIHDPRQSTKVTHEVGELLAQRVHALACGYADANDAARLADDPIHKLILGRDPSSGDALASQPTLSRFENAANRSDLFRLGVALGEAVIERHRRRLRGRTRRITIDIDPTDDLTHGGQQLALFNGFYGGYCYLPLLGFLRFDDEPEQYLFTAVLRPGNAEPKRGIFGILRRLLERIIDAFPEAELLVRLDGGFSGPELFAFLDAAQVDYVIGMAENPKLRRLAEAALTKARRRSRRTGRSQRVFTSFRYATRTWGRTRRVLMKAEVVCLPGREPRDNPRFVVTSLKGSARWIYEREYCARGEVENRVKELKLGLEIDRTSCSRFLANQFRVLMTAAAYVLMQEIRLGAKGTRWARAQVTTLRDHVLKLGARVVESVRRVVVHLPTSYPYLKDWHRLARALGARAG